MTHETTRPTPDVPRFLGRMVSVPEKLLSEAHACMRACGWQLAPADPETDPVLGLAVAEIERQVGEILAKAGKL